MKAVEIKKDIYWVGAKDWNLREFHGYNTPDGSTYNAYLIMDKEITLVDGVKHYMTEEQLNRIKSVVDFSEIKYVVVNHVEQDHSGSIPQIMKLAPQAEVVTNMAGKQALDAHYDTAGWNFKIIKTGEVINIGNRNITFLTTPMLHWPDSMMTYIVEDKVLMSNDGFGQHLCCEALFVKDYPNDLVFKNAKSYYANILMPIMGNLTNIQYVIIAFIYSFLSAILYIEVTNILIVVGIPNVNTSFFTGVFIILLYCLSSFSIFCLLKYKYIIHQNTKNIYLFKL